MILGAEKVDEANLKKAMQLIKPKESWVLLAAMYGNPTNKDNAVSMQDLQDYFLNRPDKAKIMSVPTLNRIKAKMVGKSLIAKQDGLKIFYTPNWKVVAGGLSPEDKLLYQKLIQSRVYRTFFNPYSYPKEINYPHLLAGNMFAGSIITHALTVQPDSVMKEDKPTIEDFKKKMLASSAVLPSSLKTVVEAVFNDFFAEYAKLTEEEAKLFGADIHKLGKALLEFGARQRGMQ